MKIVQINTFSNKSTGTIMINIHKKLLDNGIESYVVWGRGRKSNSKYEIFMNDKVGVYYHGLYTRITDKTGFSSKRATKKLLQKLDEIKPDIIHLHNIHGYYINIEMLFNYIKKNNIKVVWTLHDCWTFTGHCTYFDMIRCDKWEKECYNCPQLNTYPISYIDNSKWNYKKKKELFIGLDMTIITPSEWLANLVKKSFLKEYEIKVINNGIDTNIFKPRNSDFRIKYNLENKKIILGVASEWTERKGLNDFIKLSNIIDNSTKIVLVGLNNKQIKQMPKNIIALARTKDAKELAKIYSTADVFFNPTYDDNFPTTNLEAIACGTPVITYNTGGSPECLENKNNGIVIDKGKYEDVLKILPMLNKKISNFDNKYKKQHMLNNYLSIYYELYNK